MITAGMETLGALQDAMAATSGIEVVKDEQLGRMVDSLHDGSPRPYQIRPLHAGM